MLVPGNNNAKALKPLKWYKSLATPKGRLQSGAFIAEGERAVKQIISGHPQEVLEIVTSVASPFDYTGYPVRHVTDAQMRSISQMATPSVTMAIVKIPSGVFSGGLPQKVGDRVLLLEDIQDPGNVGTLIRTAVAFGFSGVILTDKCTDPFSPKCIQSTAGAVLSIWIRRTSRYVQLVDELRKYGYSLISGDLNGQEDNSTLSQTSKIVLAMGNEGSGLSQAILDMSDYRFRIPIDQNKVESLNVASSGAICMYLSSLHQ